VTRSFAEAYGIEKSAISERFQASRNKLKELMQRPLGDLKLCAIVINGTPFRGRRMIAAVGVGNDGKKAVLGLREGATEDTTVGRELLEGPSPARIGLHHPEAVCCQVSTPSRPYGACEVNHGWRKGSRCS